MLEFSQLKYPRFNDSATITFEAFQIHDAGFMQVQMNISHKMSSSDCCVISIQQASNIKVRYVPRYSYCITLVLLYPSLSFGSSNNNNNNNNDNNRMPIKYQMHHHHYHHHHHQTLSNQSQSTLDFSTQQSPSSSPPLSIYLWHKNAENVPLLRLSPSFSHALT